MNVTVARRGLLRFSDCMYKYFVAEPPADPLSCPFAPHLTSQETPVNQFRQRLRDLRRHRRLLHVWPAWCRGKTKFHRAMASLLRDRGESHGGVQVPRRATPSCCTLHCVDDLCGVNVRHCLGKSSIAFSGHDTFVAMTRQSIFKKSLCSVALLEGEL